MAIKVFKVKREALLPLIFYIVIVYDLSAFIERCYSQHLKLLGEEKWNIPNNSTVITKPGETIFLSS